MTSDPLLHQEHKEGQGQTLGGRQQRPVVVVLDMGFDSEMNSLELDPGSTTSRRVVASDGQTDPTREQQPNAIAVMGKREHPISSEDAGYPHPAGHVDRGKTNVAPSLAELLPGCEDWAGLVDWVPLKFRTIKGQVRECESIEEPYIERGNLPRHPMKPPLDFLPLKGQRLVKLPKHIRHSPQHPTSYCRSNCCHFNCG